MTVLIYLSNVSAINRESEQVLHIRVICLPLS